MEVGQGMKTLLAFPRAMLTMPKIWQGWMALMIMLNAVVPLLYIQTVEGKAVLAAFLVAVVLMMAIHHAKGFVRLLGTGHFVWFPLLAWLATRLDATSGPMRAWLIALIIVNGLSLVIDVIELVRYLRGNRDIPVRR